MYKNFRYIYNRCDKSEELYDIDWDPNQNFNLIEDEVLDVDRHVMVKSRELYFYNNWENLPEIRKILRDARMKMWREPSKKQLFVTMIKKNKLVRKIGLPLLKYIEPHK